LKNYYATETVIRYYGPQVESVRSEAGHVYAEIGQPFAVTPKWKQPPHEYLAGMELARWDAERISTFSKQYGPLVPRHRPDEIPTRRGVDYFRRGDRIWIDTAQFVVLQKLLTDAWRGDPGALEEIVSGLTDVMELKANANGLELAVFDLFAYVRLLFLRDRAQGKTNVCANPDCRTPCFLQARKGQLYCSHDCAVLINVRRFRNREARRTRKSQRKSKRR
jgi:hypothetical protein